MDKASVIHAWVVAGVKDFYISFEFEAENRWREYSRSRDTLSRPAYAAIPASLCDC